ncbi:MAG: hypothetical protein WC069_07425 [Candidatus Shapirobacteria bacterium]
MKRLTWLLLVIFGIINIYLLVRIEWIFVNNPNHILGDSDLFFKALDFVSSVLTYILIIVFPGLLVGFVYYLIKKRSFANVFRTGSIVMSLAFMGYSFYLLNDRERQNNEFNSLQDFDSIAGNLRLETSKIRTGKFSSDGYLIERDSAFQKSTIIKNGTEIWEKIEWKSNIEYWLIDKDTTKVIIYEIGSGYYKCYTNYYGKARSHTIKIN